jgi:hypothetical protein
MKLWDRCRSDVIRDGIGFSNGAAQLQANSPAFFLFAPENRRFIAAVHPDGVFVGKPNLFSGAVPTRPAKPGDIILLFGTSFGPTNPPVPAGQLFSGVAPVEITGWTTQHASASGSTWDSTPLVGTIRPGQYYLIKEGMGQSEGTVPLPTPDAIGGIGLSATSAKIALVTELDLLTGAAPSDPRIADLVGYGSATFAEGTPAPKLTNTTAAIRNGAGYVDTDDNVSDFTEMAPAPRNSSNALLLCN